jgi:hypothetical protein
MQTLLADAFIESVRDLMPNRYLPLDLFDEALMVFHQSDYDMEAALMDMKSIIQAEYSTPHWTVKETERFENGVVKYGHELKMIQKEVHSFFILTHPIIN